MNEKQQIEEMARTLCGEKEHACEGCDSSDMCEFWTEASTLYNAGYRKQSEGEWISVEEGLPDRQCEVLAYYGFAQEDYHRTNEPIQADDLGYMMVGVLTYFAYDLNPHFQHESTGLRVTHWMPLPEAPEGR